MTTMDYTTTLRAAKRLKVQTGSMACLGCGYEHACSVHGCAILRNVVEHMEAALANYDHLSTLADEQVKTIREYEAELEKSKRDRDALEETLKEHGCCEECLHFYDLGKCDDLADCDLCGEECYCRDCHNACKWEWRGVDVSDSDTHGKEGN